MNGDQGETLTTSKREPRFEFWLVVIMLVILAILLILLLLLPFLLDDDSVDNDKMVEFSKWVIPALLGAFGAWIGAGAAYFFGKESLKESTKTTQKVLDTFRTNLDKYLIEDAHPMAFDPEFKFNQDSLVKKVLDALAKKPDYSWVPIFENKKINDVIHLEAFWRYKAEHPAEEAKKATVKNVVDYIETQLADKKHKLHGFFTLAKLADKITDVLEKMRTERATVAIICDVQGIPTHCISQKNLRAFLLNVR